MQNPSKGGPICSLLVSGSLRNIRKKRSMGTPWFIARGIKNLENQESTHLKHVESPTAAELEATQIDIYHQTTSNLKAPINHRIVDLWNE